jgi:excisionase family DNA binding protein
MAEHFLTVRGAARALGVHENTVRNWETSGALRAVHLPRSGFRRFRPDDVEKLKSEMRAGTEMVAGSDRRLGRVLQLLQTNEARLRKLGVSHVAVFGSTARGEARPDSDVDLLLELDSKRRLDIFDFVGIQDELHDILPFPVDCVLRKGLKRHVAPNALRDAIRVF